MDGDGRKVETSAWLKRPPGGLALLGLALVGAACLVALGVPWTQAAAGAAVADCSEQAAIAAATPLGLVSNPQLEHPVSVLCGAFLGAGSHAMAVTFTNGTCVPDTGWAVFRDDGGTWALLDPPGEVKDVILPLTAAGNDIREEYAVYRSGDSPCQPSGGTRVRLWHWDGAKLVAGTSTQLQPPTGGSQSGTSAAFLSPSRNLSCEMNDRRPNVGSYVYCQSFNRPHSVKLTLNGHFTVCRDRSRRTTHCLGDPGEHTPVLGYGHQKTVGRFRCRSRHAGITCTVIRSGKGFEISKKRVRRVGPR
jgi:hypothetical protein